MAVDLAAASADEGVLLRVHGSAGVGSSGVPVAGGFDCDGDGLRDYALAAMRASPLGRSGAGEVHLVFGNGRAGGRLDTAQAQPRILHILGDGTSEATGSEIWMDDVTGDGLGDLLIARQNFRPDAARPGAGALTILVGGAALRDHAATLQPLDLRAPPASVTLTTLVGAAAVDRLGIWMRTGDVTGDGIADLVVGADQEDGAGENDRGAVYVIRGGAHLAVDQTIDLADPGSTALTKHLARIAPPPGSEEFHFGATLQVADLDGNGRGEVLIAAALNRAGAGIPADGAPPGSAHGGGGSLDGTLYIAWDDNFPSGLWNPNFAFDIDSPPGSRTIIDGGALNRSFGEEILGGLDYDDDGLADLFVGDLVGDGTPGQTRPASGIGHVLYAAASLKGLVFDLDVPPPGLVQSTFLGGAAGDIAADTAAHGDFDADGLDDLSFSSPHGSPLGRDDAGTIHVFYGQSGPWPALIDLEPGSLPPPAAVRISEVYGANGTVGSDAGDTLCYSAAAGDLDGDGRTDLITNEMLGNGLAPGTEDVGNLLVLSGALVSGVPGCSDGLDNDGDGRTDAPGGDPSLVDPGCDSAADPSEKSPGLRCDDGVDNDADGSADFLAGGGGDLVCLSPVSPDETAPCQDGFDNEGDGRIDFDGGASLDLDGDGFVDEPFNPAQPALTAPDPQCAGHPWKNKEGSGCGLGLELVLLLPPLMRRQRRRRPRGR